MHLLQMVTSHEHTRHCTISNATLDPYVDHLLVPFENRRLVPLTDYRLVPLTGRRLVPLPNQRLVPLADCRLVPLPNQRLVPLPKCIAKLGRSSRLSSIQSSYQKKRQLFVMLVYSLANTMLKWQPLGPATDD